MVYRRRDGELTTVSRSGSRIGGNLLCGLNGLSLSVATLQVCGLCLIVATRSV